MDCNEARLLIDEKVQGLLAAAEDARLAEHLAACPDCAQDLEQLRKTRALLAQAREDKPPAAELARIWEKIQSAQHATPPSKGNDAMTPAAPFTVLQPPAPAKVRGAPSRFRVVAASVLAVAAMLMISYTLGVAQFGPRDQHALQMNAEPLGVSGTATNTLSIVDAPFAPEQDRAVKDEALHLYYNDPKGDDGRLFDKWTRTGANQPPVDGNLNDMFDDSKSMDRKGVKKLKSEQLGRTVEAPAAAPVVVHEEGEVSRFDGQPGTISGEYHDLDKLNDKKGGADPEAPAKRPPAEPKGADRPKIVKTGELTVEVKDYTEASRKADELIVKFLGFAADSRTQDLPGGTKRGTIVIRVAPEKFEELFAELKKLGNVLNERAGGRDITAEYVDVEARIVNLKVAEERLQELIKTKTFMDKIESLLAVERELARVRGEIEGYQGQMRVWQDQIALSTIRLTIQEPTRAVPSGSLSVEVGGLAEAKQALDAALAKAGGQLLSGQTSKRGDGTLQGDYRLRVRFGSFGELVGAIKALGRTQGENIANQPFGGAVPQGAEDVPCELALVLFERSVQLPSGNLNVEVQAMSDAMQKLNVALAAAQASIVSNQTQRQDDGSTASTLALQVRAGNFQGLMDALPALGRVAHRVVSGEAAKVQGGAAEVPCTVNLYLFEPAKQVPKGTMTVEVGEFTAARNKLSALIQERGLHVMGSSSNQRPDGTWAGSFRLGIKADAMDPAVQEIEAFGRVRNRNLQGLGLGDLSKVDPNVLGEVTVTLQEPPKLTPQEEGSFRLMLRETFGGFLTSMGYIVRGLGMILPWLAIFALVVYAAVRWSRRNPEPAAAPVASKADQDTKTGDEEKAG